MGQRPNILFLVSDEHSHRFLGSVPESCGGEPAHTPALDRLAAAGARFDAAYCQMPLCSPSRMSMLTGLECRRAGAWFNENVLRPELPTMATAFGRAGYDTCLLGKSHVAGANQMLGFTRRPYGDLTGGLGHQWEPLGSDETGPYAMRIRTTHTGVTEIPESLLQERVIHEEAIAYLREQLNRNCEQPWFLMLSYSRPHFPLTAPQRHIDRYKNGVTKPFASSGDVGDHPHIRGLRDVFQSDEITDEECQAARQAYFASVTFLDEVIGDTLDQMERGGFLDNTIIIYTSDHGEMAGEHGLWWKQTWHEGSSRVPLIVSLPEHRDGKIASSVIATPVGLVDLFPTLCRLAGIESPEQLDGKDWATALMGKAGFPDRPIVCDNLVDRFGKGTEFRMVRWGEYKYIRFRDAPSLCFNLATDPGEQRNLCRTGEEREQWACLADYADSSMDFAEAETERTVRDAGLLEKYPLPITFYPGNVYAMLSGKLIGGDEVLLHPRILGQTVDLL